jgi:hypothetical protein
MGGPNTTREEQSSLNDSRRSRSLLEPTVSSRLKSIKDPLSKEEAEPIKKLYDEAYSGPQIDGYKLRQARQKTKEYKRVEDKSLEPVEEKKPAKTPKKYTIDLKPTLSQTASAKTPKTLESSIKTPKTSDPTQHKKSKSESRITLKSKMAVQEEKVQEEKVEEKPKKPRKTKKKSPGKSKDKKKVREQAQSPPAKELDDDVSFQGESDKFEVKVDERSRFPDFKTEF